MKRLTTWVFTSAALLFAAAMPATGDCVECNSSQECDDPVYNDWQYCKIEQIGGQFWCNHFGECGPSDAEEVLLAMTLDGRSHSSDGILSSDGERLVTACGEYVVRTLSGDVASADEILI